MLRRPLAPITTLLAWTAFSEHAFAQAAAETPAASPASGTWLEALEAGSAMFLARLNQAWHAELFKAGDTSITLNQLIIALLVVAFGVALSRRVTLLVQSRLIRVQRIDTHAAQLIQKLMFWTLVGIVVLVALPIAGIPITIFTVLSGAVAIGVGLGTQNLFHNLISGLTIMLEKPIRIGDVVQVGDHTGRIETIGNRVTRIRRFDGIDVLIPNSHFLDAPVVNWTLVDDCVEGCVTVGVAYGSPTEQVAKLLQSAARAHPEVLKDREVLVLFKDFGADALTFAVEFWTRITEPDDLERVCSEVRFKIDALCREANICMAFPQRDVHLDSIRPLEVKLVTTADRFNGEIAAQSN